MIAAYQWTQLPNGIPVTLITVNTATPIFTSPVVHIDTVLGFSLRVMDNHGAISTNPAIVYVMVKHNPNIGPTISSSNTPGPSANQPQQQTAQFAPNQVISPNIFHYPTQPIH